MLSLTPLDTMISSKKIANFQLRDYQMGALEACSERHRGLIKVSTGGGKTAIAAALIKHIGLKTLVLVERVNLATQTKEAYIDYGFKKSDVGVLGDKYNEQNGSVLITTVQSSHKIEDLDSYEVVIADESHHVKAKTYIKLLRKMKNAYYRFGFSGTVFGEDDVDDTYRISQFGNIIYEIGTKTLVEAGVLAKPTIRMIEIKKPQCGHISPYIEEYKLGIANNYHRNNIIAKFANQLQGKTVILFKFIEHGQNLHKLIPNAMCYMDGDTPTKERSKMLKAFNRASQGVLIASTIMDEGIDFSSIDHLIIGGGEKSVIKGIQRLGRGLRSDGSGKDTVNVIDFWDKTSNTLERHSRKRMKLYQAESHTVKIFKLEE